jgi:superfamily II DNA/RNA helicase
MLMIIYLVGGVRQMKQQKKNSLKHHIVASTTSNKHLEGWLKPPKPAFNPFDDPSDSLNDATTTPFINVAERGNRERNHRKKDSSSEPTISLDQTPPRVLITTSLLSRGLDFSPSIKHVILVDQARDQVDFLHRAGRTGRGEGGVGNVYVFDSGDVMKRRGSGENGGKRSWSGGNKVVRVGEGKRGTVPGWVGTMIRRKGERREEEEKRDPAAKARRRQDNEKIPMTVARKDGKKEKQRGGQQLSRDRKKLLFRRG